MNLRNDGISVYEMLMYCRDPGFEWVMNVSWSPYVGTLRIKCYPLFLGKLYRHWRHFSPCVALSFFFPPDAYQGVIFFFQAGRQGAVQKAITKCQAPDCNLPKNVRWHAEETLWNFRRADSSEIGRVSQMALYSLYSALLLIRALCVLVESSTL